MTTHHGSHGCCGPAPDHRPSRRALLGGAVGAATAVALAACTPSPQAEPRTSGAAPRPGQLVFPVAGRATFSDTFGAPRAGGRTHLGQDIFGPKMAAAVACVDGVVSWLRYTPGGNFLIVRGDDGWTYYYVHLNNDRPGTDDGTAPYELAFADGIRQGQRVRAGETIGFIGDSGDAESTSPHLHFETRGPDGVAVNCFDALRSATRWQRSDADVAADRPRGAVEVIARTGDGSLRVAGWALDAHAATPVAVSVYVAGNPVRTVTAEGVRPDVGAAHPGRGDRHGFDLLVRNADDTPVPVGIPVAVIAHSVGGGGNSRLTTSPAP